MKESGVLNIEQTEEGFSNVHLTQEQCEYVHTFLCVGIQKLEEKEQKNDSELEFLEEMIQIVRVFNSAESAVIRTRSQ